MRVELPGELNLKKDPYIKGKIVYDTILTKCTIMTSSKTAYHCGFVTVRNSATPGNLLLFHPTLFRYKNK